MSESKRGGAGVGVAAGVSALVVGAVIAGGAWFVVYGMPSKEAMNWWVLGGTAGVLGLAVAGLRYVDPRRMSVLEKCLIVSVLLHVMVAMMFSAVGVTRQVVRWVRHEEIMQPTVNLQLSREMEVREQVRQQVQDVKVEVDARTFVRPQANTPLPPVSSAIEPVGVPGAELRQLSASRNPVAPTIPQAPAAGVLTVPLLPARPEVVPMPQSTPLPAVGGDAGKNATHVAGMVQEQLAVATSPIEGSGPGSLGAPPSSLPQGTGGGGSATGSGTGQPFSLWTGSGPVSDKVIPSPTAPRLATTPDRLPQRGFEDRQRQLQDHGGTAETEAAVARGLVYLSRVQKGDGRWTRFMERPEERDSDEHDMALTGLAVLCFLAADYTPEKPSVYQETVRRGVGFLMSHEGADGDLRGEGKMYDQGIATLALSEAAAMTRSKAIREAAHRAAKFVLEAQNGSGGWRYRPRDMFSDASVIGWQVMALHSAEQTGFKVPETSKLMTIKCLDGLSGGKQGMLTGYLLAIPTHTMTAEAMFTRMLLGQELDGEKLKEAAGKLMENLPARESLNYYYLYYGSLALMQTQGEEWGQWNGRMQRMLVGTQELGGPKAGSWEPNDLYGKEGGRVYSTAMGTLTLEVYYRYLPMYSKERH